MTKRRKIAWSLVILLLLLLAAVSLTTLRRPPVNPQQAVRSNRWASTALNSLVFTGRENADPAPPSAPSDSASGVPDRKLIRNADLGLTVVDVRAAVEQIRRITEAGGGEISDLEITESGGYVSATLTARVPASGLVSALTEYTKLAVRTDHEQISDRDVTREFYDNEAHMRNLQAEEQQYLEVMKQAHTVSDILKVSAKLSDVRDRIERLQTQMQILSHDIEMSAVQVALTQESETRILGIRWRPVYNAKVATREMLAGLGEWMDWVVEVFIKLPLILLWAVTVGALLWVVWRIGRAGWTRFLRVKNADKAQRPGSGPPAFQAGAEPISNSP